MKKTSLIVVVVVVVVLMASAAKALPPPHPEVNGGRTEGHDLSPEAEAEESTLLAAPEAPFWTRPERMERVVHAEPLNSVVRRVLLHFIFLVVPV